MSLYNVVALTLSWEDGQTVYLQQKGTKLGELHTLLAVTVTYVTSWHLENVLQNRIKCLRDEHGEYGKLKVSAPNKVF